MRKNVAVIGAGTAGLIAAKNLASLGIGTRVYEQKTRLGYPPRASGILSIKGLQGLGIDYHNAITNTLYGANIHAGMEVMRIVSEKPMAHVLDREKLNLACYDESVGTGAEVLTGVRVDSRLLDDLHKENIIVGADGAVSLVAKHFSMGSIDDYVLTYKAEFDSEPSDKRVVDMFFDRRMAHGFFGWLCPNSKDTLEVGIGISSRHGNSKSAFDRFIKINEVSAAIGKGKMLNGYASMIPMRARKSIVNEKEEVLLIGDAAGQVKSTTGGGIIFGGNAAIIAARSISDHIKKGSQLKAYERSFKKAFGMDMLMHRTLNNTYSRLDAGSMAFLIRASRALGIEAFLSRYGDMDRPSTMFKRFLLRGLAK